MISARAPICCTYLETPDRVPLKRSLHPLHQHKKTTLVCVNNENDIVIVASHAPALSPPGVTHVDAFSIVLFRNRPSSPLPKAAPFSASYVAASRTGTTTTETTTTTTAATPATPPAMGLPPTATTTVRRLPEQVHPCPFPCSLIKYGT